jgi:hypothetical protein
VPERNEGDPFLDPKTEEAQMNLRASGWLIALLLFPGAEASAVPIDWAVTGVLSQIDDLNDEVWGGQFQVGMPFTGTVRWDTAIPDSDADPEVGRYAADPAMGRIRLSMQVAGDEFETDPVAFSTILILDDGPAGDRIQVDTNPSVISSGPLVSGLELLLLSSRTDVLDDDSLPTALDIADWNQTHFLGFTSGFVSGSKIGIAFGEIRTITQIPEPGTAVLVALGLGGLAWQRRR